MKRIMTRVVTMLLLLAALPVGAQSSSQRGTGQAGADSAGPGEPEIVMPQVILQVEDLSVEKVVAQLPPEDELLPPARPVPVLSEGDLVVGDPAIPAVGAGADITMAPVSDRLLSSEVTLGAGLQNRIVGAVSLKTLGADPRFALRFNHETLDGFSGQKPGSGFSMRNDLLDGSLKFRLGANDASLGGNYTETENGLQGLSTYGARFARSVSGTADFTAAPLTWLSLGVGVDASTDTLTLEATAPTNPVQRSDLVATPRLSAQARFGAVTLGLQSRYSYRSDTGIPGAGLHRFSVGTSFGANLPATFILAGDVGWFWNSDGLSLVPFSLSITGTPWEFLTLSLSGGYAVQTYDLHDVLVSHSLALPGSIVDDHGWFGNSSVKLTITRDLSASFALSFMASTALPMGATTQDPATGLFVVSQAPGNRLSADGGLRWGISPSFSVAAGWHHEFLPARPFFTPVDSLSAEIVGLEAAGRFGGSLSVLVASTPAGLVQPVPVLRLSVFGKVSDAVKLQIDGDDLLWPLLGGARSDIEPYVTPGFRVTGSLGMNL